MCRLIIWGKMGLGQNGVVLAFFFSQNDVILALQGLFFFNSAYTKTTSFWTKLVQNGVVLEQLSHTQNDVVWVNDSCFKTTSFWTSFVQNDVVLLCIKKKKKKRRRFISSIDKTTSFHQPPCLNTVFSSSFQFAFFWGGGGVFQFAAGGGEDRAAWPTAARWDRRSHMMSEIAAAAGDWGFGPTSER